MRIGHRSGLQGESTGTGVVSGWMGGRAPFVGVLARLVLLKAEGHFALERPRHAPVLRVVLPGIRRPGGVAAVVVRITLRLAARALPRVCSSAPPRGWTGQSAAQMHSRGWAAHKCVIPARPMPLLGRGHTCMLALPSAFATATSMPSPSVGVTRTIALVREPSVPSPTLNSGVITAAINTSTLFGVAIPVAIIGLSAPNCHFWASQWNRSF